MKAASVFPSEFNQFATAFCKIWFLLSERSSLLTKKNKKILSVLILHMFKVCKRILHVQQHLYSLVQLLFCKNIYINRSTEKNMYI